MNQTNNLKTKDELKKYFETGDFPTQSQFAELIDSLVHLNEFYELGNSIKTMDFPIIKVKQSFYNGIADWLNTIILANQGAKASGLLAEDLFWMQTDFPNTPLTLMRVEDDKANGISSGVGSSAGNGGIGGRILQTWADFYSTQNL